MEDMYGHGTEHFSGPLSIKGNSENIAAVFNYWIDMKTHEAVRLTISKVERGIVTSENSDPLSRVTYINIRFF